LRASLGLSSEQIATVLGWHPGSVRHLQARVLREGLGVLEQPGGGGRHRAHLTKVEEEALLAHFCFAAGEGGAVEAGPLRVAYEKRVEHPAARSTLYRLLARHGWRKLVPRSVSPGGQRCGTKGIQKKRRRVVSAEAARQAGAGRSLRLMFEDEARLGRSSDPPRAWVPPGVRPRVASRIVREYGYAYAAVSPHDGVLDSLVLPEVNADTRSLFLAEVARRHARDFSLMVLDGAGWHRAGDLVIPERMRLYPLPARSLELNPTEHVWDEWREKFLANRMFDGQEAVDCQVRKGLAALEQDRPRVGRFLSRLSLDQKYLTPTVVELSSFDCNSV